ncbi:tail fiber protein [Clostridioides difficile]|nr:tail fiber protein [Clostridioides difficile]
MLEKLNENASLSELITTFGNVKNELQIGKNNIAGTLGNPFAGTDKLDVTKTKIETLKNAFAANLTSKNVSASKLESMQSLIGKVSSIKNIIKTAKSENNYITMKPKYILPYGQTENSVKRIVLEINSLSFRPNLVFMLAKDSYNNYTTIAFDSTMNLMSNLILCITEEYRPSIRQYISRFQNNTHDTDTYSNNSGTGFFTNGFRIPIDLNDTEVQATVSWFAIKYE